MTSNLSQFHFLASNVPNKFDFEAEDFDVSQIYQFYSLKVITKTVLLALRHLPYGLFQIRSNSIMYV